MRIHTQQFLLFVLLLVAGPAVTNTVFINPGNNDEKVILFTDRALYIAGEKVQFFASLYNVDTTKVSGQSQVIYCELISPNGSKSGGNKYLINHSSVNGCLTIPLDLITGTYYIRAYTKQMRNYGPASYGYKQIRIVNPGRSEVLAGDYIEPVNSEQLIQSAKPEVTGIFSVSAGKPVYASHDTVNLTIRAVNESVSQITSLCLSVVPETTASASFHLPQPTEPYEPTKEYIPETRGISLTGKLTETLSQIPVKGKRINLSIIGQGRDFMAVRTDSIGRFFFALPDYRGPRDLFLCAEKTPATDLKIWIDNDFCALPVQLPSPAFSLTEQERKIALNMALNRQIYSNFHNDTLQESPEEKSEEHAFYGEPSNVLYLDQYVQLPTLEEYFNELSGLVKVRRRNSQKYFKMIGSDNLSYYDPLVLVDWVAVDEPERILAVTPQNLSRIEMVNELYIKGGQTYGGIISIISKKGNFAGIDLPSAGIFINYQFLAKNNCIDKVDDEGSAHPDVRNTLLWEPGITIGNGKSEKFTFTAPDTPGKYIIILEGINPNGECIRETGYFEVRNR
jgi:hypothetical protein